MILITQICCHGIYILGSHFEPKKTAGTTRREDLLRQLEGGEMYTFWARFVDG